MISSAFAGVFAGVIGGGSLGSGGFLGVVGASTLIELLARDGCRESNLND